MFHFVDAFWAVLSIVNLVPPPLFWNLETTLPRTTFLMGPVKLEEWKELTGLETGSEVATGSFRLSRHQFPVTTTGSAASQAELLLDLSRDLQALHHHFHSNASG